MRRFFQDVCGADAQTRNKRHALTPERVSNGLQSMLSWLYPRKCIVCLDILTSSDADGFCGKCVNPFAEITDYCVVCGRPLAHGDVCECAGQDMGVTVSRSLFCYDEQMSDVIHAFKYANHPAHGRTLGRLMAERLPDYFTGIDLVVPVPMHRPKERRRGYNQADILAREIARRAGLAYDNRSLMRVRRTEAQFGLSAAERKTNLSGAFGLKRVPSPVSGKNILLVDDILTTGSTLAGCAAELFRGGAAAVCGYTLAAAAKRNWDAAAGIDI